MKVKDFVKFLLEQDQEAEVRVIEMKEGGGFYATDYPSWTIFNPEKHFYTYKYLDEDECNAIFIGNDNIP